VWTHSPDDDKKFPGMGGMAQKAALIKKIRAEEDNVLLLDAGDIFKAHLILIFIMVNWKCN
jgi:2',3'-cyclic-nucleotide 2'-phosphodiesterase (5'-nucleotidase family)